VAPNLARAPHANFTLALEYLDHRARDRVTTRSR
jgi:hypothetical protein